MGNQLINTNHLFYLKKKTTTHWRFWRILVVVMYCQPFPANQLERRPPIRWFHRQIINYHHDQTMHPKQQQQILYQMVTIHLLFVKHRNHFKRPKYCMWTRTLIPYRKLKNSWFFLIFPNNIYQKEETDKDNDDEKKNMLRSIRFDSIRAFDFHKSKKAILLKRKTWSIA